MEPENEVNNELKKMGADLPGRTQHIPPEGYFDKLPENIISRWNNEETGSGSATKWYTGFAIAAIISGFLIGGWLIFKGSDTYEINSISSYEAYQYVDENIDDFVNLIDIIEFNSDVFPVDIPQEAIDDYLIEETDETTPEDLF